jgi:hypothetical protein
MKSLNKLIACLLLASISTAAFAVTNAEAFAFAESNFPSIFTGSPTAGQTLYQGTQYDYRYYPTSGNYLAVDASGVISILGPYTGGKLTLLGPVSTYTNSIGSWEDTLIPYTITAHAVSDKCRLPDDRVVSGVLTPTGQPNTYTTLFIANTAITLTVPGSNTLDYSFPDGSSVDKSGNTITYTTTEHSQLTFNSQSRLISGSTNWTNTDGCVGSMTFSGSFGSAGLSTVSQFNGAYTGSYSSSAITTPFTATVTDGVVTISVANGTGGMGVVSGMVTASGVGALTSFSNFSCPPTSGSMQITITATGGAVMSAISYSPPNCHDGPSGTWTATRS